MTFHYTSRLRNDSIAVFSQNHASERSSTVQQSVLLWREVEARLIWAKKAARKAVHASLLVSRERSFNNLQFYLNLTVQSITPTKAQFTLCSSRFNCTVGTLSILKSRQYDTIISTITSLQSIEFYYVCALKNSTPKEETSFTRSKPSIVLVYTAGLF